MQFKNLILCFFFLFTISFSQAQTTKKVLAEKFTSSNCGNCPDGTARLIGMTDTLENLIWVSIHSGFITDPMSFPAIDSIAPAFTSGAPKANFDRIKFGNESEVATNRSNWLSHAQNQLSQTAEVAVDLEGSYHPITRVVNLNVKSTFDIAPTASDLRMNIYVVEDSVVGSGNQWNQANYFNTTAGHYYQGAGSPIVGYAHRHVVREVITYAWGDDSVIPSSPILGTVYQKDYTYTIPNDYDINNLRFVAFVSNYDADVNNREVLNANEIDVVGGLTTITNTKNIVANNFNFDFAPNPATNGQVNLAIQSKQMQDVQIRVYNAVGQMVVNESKLLDLGENRMSLNIENLANGQYFVQILGEQQAVKKLIIID